MASRAKALLLTLAVLVLCAFAVTTQAKDPRLQVEYTVKVESLGEQLYHARINIKNIDTPQLRLDLPMYRPGIYTTNFFIKNIFDFKIRDAAGNALGYVMPQKQTWLVETPNIKEVEVSFNYRADVLSASQAYLDNEVGFFTGVHFFPIVNNQRDLSSVVRLEVPQGWAVLSTLKETSDPLVYTAANYDSLADSQTMVGKFDLTKFEVDGQPRYFAATPVGRFSKAQTAQMIDLLTKIDKVQTAIFGERPFDKYLFFYIFKQRIEDLALNTVPEIQSMNSHLHIVRPNDDDAQPARMFASANHNFFHSWNLMRMRPVQYWPLDYSREVETPLLWLAEGVTRYYMTITRLRAHAGDRSDFMARLSEAINDIERRPSRTYLSLANASVLSGVRYEGPLEADYSYIMGGHIIGALLDLSIRKDTDSRASFDDVMRLLYQQSYKKDRGYDTEDVIQIINGLTKRDYHDFFRRYVVGTEIPPYDQILGYAGYRLEKIVTERPSLGLLLERKDQGVTLSKVLRGSAAEIAGLQRGDTLLTVGDLDIAKNGFTGVRELVDKQKGQHVPVTIKRGDEIKKTDMLIGTVQDVEYRVLEVSNPTPEQIKLRDAWLKQ